MSIRIYGAAESCQQHKSTPGGGGGGGARTPTESTQQHAIIPAIKSILSSSINSDMDGGDNEADL